MVELKPPEQRLEPPELHPPDDQLPVAKKGNLLFTLLLVVTVFLLLDLAILAYWLWPERESFLGEYAAEEPAVVSSPQVVVEEAVKAAPAPSGEQLQAEEALGLWLQRQAEARAENVENWGGIPYGEALNEATEGDQLLAAGDFVAAKQAYHRAERTVAGLLADRPALLASLLRQGHGALEGLDAKGAGAAFTRALAIDPQNQQALAGAQRAGTLDRVAGLVQEAGGLEAAGDLSAAAELLSQAQALDPAFELLRAASERVGAKIESREMAEALGHFYAHLKIKAFRAAEAALGEAAALRPNDPAVADGRRLLNSARESEALKRLQQDYVRLRDQEAWQTALETAEQALEIDPEAGFAMQGRQESMERIALDNSLQRTLDAPLRLQDDGPFAEASALLAEASALSSAGKRLQQQIAGLERLLTEARQEVSVLLRSDDLTEVVIYRVGRLGRFQEKMVALRPGQYTLVGTRPGFRDIRRSLRLAPGTVQAEVVIRCEEPI